MFSLEVARIMTVLAEKLRNCSWLISVSWQKCTFWNRIRVDKNLSSVRPLGLALGSGQD